MVQFSSHSILSCGASLQSPIHNGNTVTLTDGKEPETTVKISNPVSDLFALFTVFLLLCDCLLKLILPFLNLIDAFFFVCLEVSLTAASLFFNLSFLIYLFNRQRSRFWVRYICILENLCLFSFIYLFLLGLFNFDLIHFFPHLSFSNICVDVFCICNGVSLVMLWGLLSFIRVCQTSLKRFLFNLFE